MTLFTVCTCIDSDTTEIVPESSVIVSDDMIHGKLAVSCFLGKILENLKAKHPTIEKIDFFSDGASSQFKQKYMFTNLTFFQEIYDGSITWNFFATSHGKGAVDGIGDDM